VSRTCLPAPSSTVLVSAADPDCFFSNGSVFGSIGHHLTALFPLDFHLPSLHRYPAPCGDPLHLRATFMWCRNIRKLDHACLHSGHPPLFAPPRRSPHGCFFPLPRLGSHRCEAGFPQCIPGALKRSRTVEGSCHFWLVTFSGGRPPLFFDIPSVGFDGGAVHPLFAVGRL